MGKVIGIDTVLFIYLLEDHPVYAETVQRVLNNIVQGGHQGVLASIGVLEILTGPYKTNRVDLVNIYSQYLDGLNNFAVVYDNPFIIKQAAELRAQYALAAPDAIHLATAIFLEADYFLTNDKKLKKVKEIKVKLLTE